MIGLNEAMRKITYYESILEFKENNKKDLNVNEINNWKLCRTCLVDTDENAVNIENMNIMDTMHGTILSINKMLNDITSIKISNNENLPVHVCNTCFTKITELYYFCNQIRKAEEVMSRLAKRFNDHTDATGLCETNDNIKVEFEEYTQDMKNIDIRNIPIDENEVESPKQDNKNSTELINEISDSESVLLKSEEVALFDMEFDNVLKEENESESGNHIVQNNSPCDEESHLENNLVEYWYSDDTESEVPSTNSAVESKEIFKKKLKTIKGKARKKKVASTSTRYTHKQQRITAPLLDDFDCPICQIPFSRLIDVAQHVRESHPNSKAFKCRVCSKSFSHIQSLSLHMNTHKDYVVFNECEYCSKSFMTTSDLKRHIRIHTEKKTYNCSICETEFHHLAAFKSHQKKHDCGDKNLKPKMYECIPCKIPYTSRMGLYWHNKKYHKKVDSHKPPRITAPLLDDLDCSICQIPFSRLIDVAQHVRESHPNSKAFKCRICSNRFSHIQSLSRHMNSHKIM